MSQRAPRMSPVLRRPADLLAAAAALMQRRRADQAVAALELAAEQALASAPALTLLGEALTDLAAYDAAEAALRRSLAADPAPARPRLALGRLLLRRYRYAEGVAVLTAAEALAPDDADILTVLGQCLIGLGRLDEARARLARAAELAPDDAWPHLGLALAHFLAGDWAKAWPEYRWRRTRPGRALKLRQGDVAWAGESLFGKSILLFGEQGSGDTIQFLRFAPVLAEHGAEVWVACTRDILPIAQAGPRVTPFTGPTRRRFDFVSSLVDAADILGVGQDDPPAPVPYVTAPARAVLPAAPAGTRLRIGICWAGNPVHSNDGARSCPLEPFLPLLALPGIELVSLQVGPRSADIAAAGATALVTDPSARLQDYGDTAAAIAGLDLVISVDTSVAHLAGALAKPVWVLLPALPDWRWGLGRAATPWYPSMRLYRQAEPGDWAPVFAAIAADLAGLAAGIPRGPVTAAAAAEADRLHALGMKEMEADRLDAACDRLGQTLRAVADPPNTWNNLGVALRRLRHFAAAEATFRRAAALSEAGGALGNLANTLGDLGRLDEARALQGRLLEGAQSDASAFYNYGIIVKNQGDCAAALAAFDSALALDPAYRDARWDRAHELLRLGNWDEGWREYEVRWSLPEAGALSAHAPMWTGQDPAGKTVLVLPEQGFGDTLFALRYLDGLKRQGARVVMQCQPELFRLLARSGLADALVPKGVAPPMAVDYQVACMSLPGIAGNLDPGAGRPYLAADPALAGFVAAAIPAGPVNIGIVWSGSLTFKGNSYRRASLADFLPLAADPRVRLYALQKGPAADDVDQLHCAALVTPLGALLTDFDVTAAVLDRLDAVVMTDSSVVHLAGALGRPVWAVLGERPYWLWGQEAERTRWYDSVRLVRKQPGEAWAAAILRAGRAAVDAAAP